MMIALVVLIFTSCSQQKSDSGNNVATPAEEVSELVIVPRYSTPSLPNDSDDPAIWINREYPEKSLIVGTDKGDSNGGLYMYTLKGEKIPDREVFPLLRPNNVDIAYGIELGDSIVDIAVVTERIPGKIRVYSMPDLKEIDNGGIHVFEDDTANAVMGVALYTRPADGEIFAIVSRKTNPVDEDDYLYQYKLDGSNGVVTGELVRKFGKFSGVAEVEAIAIDNELGYVYYSDEMTGIRKYYADPEKGNDELAMFGTHGFTDDREGITIYKTTKDSGFLLVSDQGANKFRVFPREGASGDPHDHPEIAVLTMNTISSDGSEVTSIPLGTEFPKGVFVAMSDNRTFEIYDWQDLYELIETQSSN